MGLARERLNLNATGLPDNIIRTIQGASQSTRSLYDLKWAVFDRWSDQRSKITFQCSIPMVLSFLQDLVDTGKAFSTIKVCLAIPACHLGICMDTLGTHPLVCL